MPASDPHGETLDQDLSGLDALEIHIPSPQRTITRLLWAAAWPKIAAVAIVLFLWQLVAWTHWRPSYVLPGPGPVFRRLGDDLTTFDLARAVGVTLRRAVLGYLIALGAGGAVGLAVVRVRYVRAALGSAITGLQTMPSIAWFPLAILLFKRGEGAITFVVVLGAAPAIANGVIAGVDHIPPILLRAGKVLGARGLSSYRHVIVPAALPGFVAGLKQGWAFAWRSLMAAELLVTLGASIGARLDLARQNFDAEGLLATMIVILAIGIVVDSLVFGTIERGIRRRRGLIDAAEAA